MATCPAKARHFGDLGDPESDISKLVERRGGFQLMPETGYEPVNRYLPPRPRRDGTGAAAAAAAPAMQAPPDGASTDIAERFFRWADKVLSR